jgi:predicted outer membrane protein
MAGIRGRKASALAAAVLSGLLLGSGAYADDSNKEARQIGKVAAEGKLYVDKLAVFNAKQIALGELALQQSEDPMVLKFARQLVQDHRQSQAELKNWTASKAYQMSSIDMSGTGGSGIQIGYDEEMKGKDSRKYEAIRDAQKDVNDLRKKDGKDFDKDFLSKVLKDQDKGKELLGEGKDKYENDAVFSSLISKNRTLLDSHIASGKRIQDIID